MGEILEVWIKVTGLLASTGFGIYGLGHDLRDSQKNLTRQGKVALAGILSGAALTGFSLWNDRAAGRAAADDRRILVEAAERQQYATDGARLNMSYWLDRSLLNDDGYADALDATMRAAPPRTCIPLKRQLPHEPTSYDCGDYSNVYDFEGTHALEFRVKSSIFPNAKTYPSSNHVLRYSGWALHFWKANNDPKDRLGNLALWIEQFQEDAALNYDGKKLTVTINDAIIPREAFQTARVTSLVDIRGGRARFQARVVCPPAADNCSERARGTQGSVGLWGLRIMFPHRRDLVFPRTSGDVSWQRVENTSGPMTWQIELPKDLNGFREVKRRPGEF